MDYVVSYEQISCAVNAIKSYKGKYLTNFFVGKECCILLIKNSMLYAVNYEKCVFILYKDHDFYHLYFVCAAEKYLTESLKNLIKQYPDCVFVTDIVGIQVKVEKLTSVFLQNEFKRYTSLYRMSRIKNINQPQIIDKRVEYAAIEYAEQIQSLFEAYFDRYSEQIPLLEEIRQFINSNQVLVIKEQQKIMGFVIFEINGVTSYLRYWFVLPEYRDKKIGSFLLKRFFHECRNTKRQLFWVITSNDNAIARYKHYGFETELMFDQVLIKSHS